MSKEKESLQKRVFHIDQECFLIFAEDLSSKKERFLRIGNCSYLKDFSEGLTFLTLVTSLYPGDPFKEIEIFRPLVDRKIIGLKETVVKFLDFLRKGGVDINHVRHVYIDKPSKNSQKKTEEDFIKEVNKHKKKQKHSFASFYRDGNIRVFNRNEVFFDLKESLSRILDEKKEIQLLSSQFTNEYKEAYNKDGLIVSGKSIFIFSDFKFLCITENTNWVLDSIRVGINPTDIGHLYTIEGVYPDSLWLKTFTSHNNDNQKIKLIVRGKNPIWTTLLPSELFGVYCPDNNKIEEKINNIELVFDKDDIFIKTKDLTINIQGIGGFSGKGMSLNTRLHTDNTETTLNIEAKNETGYTIYAYNPVIFQKITNQESLFEFWVNVKSSNANIENSIKKCLPVIEKSLKSKSSIPEDYSDNKFVNSLAFDTVRKEHFENTNDKLLVNFNKKLEGFTGEMINQNGFIFQQILLFEKKLKIGYSVQNNTFFAVQNEINPFLMFEKNTNFQECRRKFEEFNKYLEENDEIPEEKVVKMKERYNELFQNKEHFENERKDLKQFVKKIEIMETKKEIEKASENKIQNEPVEKSDKNTQNSQSNQKTKEKSAPIKDQPKNDVSESKITKSASQVNAPQQNNNLSTRSFEKPEIPRINFNINKKFFIIPMIILIFLGLIFTAIYYMPDLRFIKLSLQPSLKEKQIKSQDKFIEEIEKKYNSLEKSSYKKSVYYNFFMTNLDKLKLTNIIAEKNGYHKIVNSFQQRFVKGKDPDWIFPGTELILPDDTITEVKSGDTMWGICETFLVKSVNQNELSIRKIIEQTKTEELTITEAKEKLNSIRENVYSQMVIDFIDVLIEQDNYEQWEPYLDSIEVEETIEKVEE